MLERRVRWNLDEAGMTLVEVLIAVFILAVAVMALAATAVSSLQSVQISRDRQNATQLASGLLEQARGLPFRDVILSTTGNPPEGFNPSTGTACTVGSAGCERVIKSAGGAIPHISTSGSHTVTSYVTDATGDGKELRVTAFVSWQTKGRTQRVRQSTLIAEATRGLPAPSFNVSPTAPTGTGPTGQTICIDHTITNTGERDGYSWHLFGRQAGNASVLEPGVRQTRTVNEPDGSGNVNQISREGYRIPSTSEGKHWFGWARIAIPASDPLTPMEDTTFDGRPDSPGQLSALGQALIRICYTPINSAGVMEATDTNFTTVPVVYSAFDETVTTQSQGNQITNTIQVVSPNAKFFLRHPSSTTDPSQPAVITATPMPMTTTPSTASWTDATDYDADLIPGRRLLDSANEARWEHQFNAAASVSDPSVTLFVRTKDDTNAESDRVTIRLQLRAVTGTTTTVIANGSASLSPVGSAWQQVTVSLPLSSPVQFQSGNYLRLAMWCDTTTSSDECHMHYDAPSFQSALSATVR